MVPAGVGSYDLLSQEVENATERCWLLCSVPGPLQSVQRADFHWEFFLVLEAAAAVHDDVDI